MIVCATEKGKKENKRVVDNEDVRVSGVLYFL